MNLMLTGSTPCFILSRHHWGGGIILTNMSRPTLQATAENIYNFYLKLAQTLLKFKQKIFSHQHRSLSCCTYFWCTPVTYSPTGSI